MIRPIALSLALGTLAAVAAPDPVADEMLARHAALSRRVAGEGFVLLKNEGALPLAPGSKVAVEGPAFCEWLSCGGMSAFVKSAYVVDVPTGLRNAGFVVDPESRETAVFIVSRTCGRGGEPDLKAYELKPEEKKAFAAVKAKGYRRIVVVMNTGVGVETRPFADDPAVGALLWVGFPGMEGGNAVADVLSGKVNPAGRLVQTLANRLADYPAEENWQEGLYYVPYEDDIFVGYRYFETIPGADAKVTYPFGHGLGYTTFSRSDLSFAKDGDDCRVTVTVANVGKVAGRHSVLVYTSLRGGAADHPAKELRAFAKTRLLRPGERETLTLRFDRKDLAAFDDEGWSGRIGSWAIDGGEYSVWVGGSVREVAKAGSFTEPMTILSTPGFKLQNTMLAKRLRADGSYTRLPVTYGDRNGPVTKKTLPVSKPAKRILLGDVAAGRHTLDEFLDQLTAEELVSILVGKDNVTPTGTTGSIGRMDGYGSPGLQTADGPLGVGLYRLPTVQFPATDLLASSFDVALAEAVGSAIGEEDVHFGVDVQLAPGVNLYRHPTCARNFEYMGEDPLLAGKMASGVIRGIQGHGVASTIKHFFANQRISAVGEYTSVISERASREFYLKPFEIAVREAKPKCLMTAYNGANGRAAGSNWGAIEGILRGEWGYDGVVMSDWFARSILWEEIASGSDIKMPDDGGGSARMAQLLLEGTADLAKARTSAKRILRLVMESARFRATCDIDSEEGYVPLFDGKTLNGWRPRGGTAAYTVENGEIVGRVQPYTHRINTFLCTEKEYSDFILKLEFRVVKGNSGVQFRSRGRPSELDPTKERIFGYQVEMCVDAKETGRIYDEGRRGYRNGVIFLDRTPDDVLEAAHKDFVKDGWNKLTLRCVGPSIRTWINGHPVSDIVDRVDDKGVFGLQIHVDPVGEARWRNIRIKELNTGVSRTPEAEALLDNLRRLPDEGRYLVAWTHPWYEHGTDFVRRGPDGKWQAKPIGETKLNGYVKHHTGKDPLLYFTDFYCCLGTWENQAGYARTMANMEGFIRKAYDEFHAVPVFSWHIGNPYAPHRRLMPKQSKGEAYRYRYSCDGYPQEHRYVINEILEGTGGTCGMGRAKEADEKDTSSFPTPSAWYDAQLDKICAFLGRLKDRDDRPIPAVVRLFHECEDDWSWWGPASVSTSDYISIFRYTVGEIRRRTGLSSLLFLYSPDRYWSKKEHFMCRYPGDDVVDIIGFDDYSIGCLPKDWTGDKQEGVLKMLEGTISRMRIVSEISRERGKPAGIIETGVCGDEWLTGLKSGSAGFYGLCDRMMKAEGVAFSFFNTWGGDYTVPKTEEGKRCWRGLLNRPEALTAGKGYDLVAPNGIAR